MSYGVCLPRYRAVAATAAGVTDFLFDLAGETKEDLLRIMELFADKVRPLVAY